MGRKKIFFILLMGTLALGCIATYLIFSKTKTAFEFVSIEKQYRFSDMQDVQLAAAKKNGITPLDTRDQISKQKNEVVKISTCRAYKIAYLTHSIPYLTHDAKKLLEDIGKSFQKKLKEKGYKKHKIIVTSLLRTSDDVSKLQQVNTNAVKNSAHQYATTFDISYVSYETTSLFGKPVSNATMAQLLGQTLKELRTDGRCYVKYEKKQHCYHITVR